MRCTNALARSLGAILLLAASTDAFAEDEAAPWTQFEDPVHRVLLFHPPDWTATSILGGTTIARIAGADGNCIVLAATLRTSPSPRTEEENRPVLVEALAPDLVRPNESTLFLGFGKFELRGFPGIRVEFQRPSPTLPGLVIRELFVAVAKAERGFAIRCAAPRERFETLAPIFGGLIDSFRWLEPDPIAPGSSAPQQSPDSISKPPSRSLLPMRVGGWVASYLVCAPLIATFAWKRNRNPWAWGLLGGAFGPLGILAVFAKPPLCWLCRKPVGSGCRLCTPPTGAEAEKGEEAEGDILEAEPQKPSWVGFLEPLALFAEVQGDHAAFGNRRSPFWKRTSFRSNRALPVTAVEFSRETWELRIRLGGLLRQNSVATMGMTVAELHRELDGYRETASHCRLVFSDTIELIPAEIERAIQQFGGEWNGPPLDTLDPTEPLLYTLDLPISKMSVRRNVGQRRFILTSTD